MLRTLGLLLTAIAASALAGPRFERINSRTPQGRNLRGLLPTSGAFFEAFNGGTGTFGACSVTPPTGTTGQTITTARASNATCSTVGTATTGITNGSQSVIASNLARIEPDAQGFLGPLVEYAATNDSLRSAEICTAPWADLGTPGCLSDQATGPWGTATMDSITDNDGAAFEGRTQPITTASATVHAVQCKVKSVSGVTAASITMVGTGSATGDCTGTVTGLSTTTSSLVSCTSPAAYGGALTAVAITIRVGTVVADQGVILIEDCQHENSALGPSSIIPTTSGAVTRAADALTVTGTNFPTASYSIAASVIMIGAGSNTRGIIEGQVGANSGAGFFTVSGFLRAQNLTAGADNQTSFAWASAALTQYRVVSINDGANQTLMIDGAVVAGPTAAAHPDAPWSASTGIGYAPAFPSQLHGIITRICVDPNPARCR